MRSPSKKRSIACCEIPDPRLSTFFGSVLFFVSSRHLRDGDSLAVVIMALIGLDPGDAAAAEEEADQEEGEEDEVPNGAGEGPE